MTSGQITVANHADVVAPTQRASAETAWHKRVAQSFMQLPVSLRCTASLVLLLGIGWLDAATGWEVSLFVFYAIPITTAVWTVGLRAGIVAALLGGLIWWFANRDENPYVSTWGYNWAMVNRLAYFGFVVFGVRAIQVKQESDAAKIAMLQEMRLLEKEIVSVSEHEQQRIGQDLHDGICQQLAAVGCAARLLADELAETKHPGYEDAANIEQALRTAVVEARSLARGIFPVHVDRSGLAAALGELADSTSRLTGVKVRFKEITNVQVDVPETAMHLFRIAQEAVANAVKHSMAQSVVISLKEQDDQVILTVLDDGQGMPNVPEASRGMGLRTMMHRARTLGGNLSVKPGATGGTELICKVSKAITSAKDSKS
jgi:signal transduction histidine kinase